MNKLRRNFERFCFRNRDKGIPNLMLYIALGNALVIILSEANGGDFLYRLLCFDKYRILQGQVWRLVTYVFTQRSNGIYDLLFLYFFYALGKRVEISIGTFKFNLFYFSGVILMDVFAMIFCPNIPTILLMYSDLPYWKMPLYLHLSLMLTFATFYPDSQFLIFLIIPIKGRILALIYLALEIVGIFNLSYPVFYFPHNLFPLVALANYLLFMGADIKNLFPLSWRVKAGRTAQKAHPQRTGTIPFSPPKQASVPQNYNHRCTVCGRTDTEFPDLEFRYCSRCNGYHCYCEDHISDHEHIQ